MLSAVTAWQIALLADTSRIELDIPTEAWIERFLARPGIAAVPLSHQAACRAYQLHHFEHRARRLPFEAVGLTTDADIRRHSFGPG